MERIAQRFSEIEGEDDITEHARVAVELAREGYVSLEDAEDIVSTVIMPDPAREFLIKRFRNRLAKPAERVTVSENETEWVVRVIDGQHSYFPKNLYPKSEVDRFANRLREELKEQK